MTGSLAPLGLILTGLVAPLTAQNVRTYVPAGAVTLAPVLATVQRQVWPEAPAPWTLGGLVEQESCISLTHRRCWNSRAELKTSREYGFGLGQITIAYRADGSERFNTFTALQQEHQALRDWVFADRYNPEKQLLAIVLMVRSGWSRIKGAATADDHWAFTLSGYNGGTGDVIRDRMLCHNTTGCDPARWFGHVELTSFKSKVSMPGYGRSTYAINREHARNILTLRRDKYRPFWGVS